MVHSSAALISLEEFLLAGATLEGSVAVGALLTVGLSF